MSPANGTPIDVIDAVTRRDLNALAELLDRNPALANATDRDGQSAIVLAVYLNAPGMVDLLLQYRETLSVFEAASVGAAEQISKRVAEQPSSVNGYSVDGFTPLHLAAHFNHVDAARVLLDAGAGVTAVSRNTLLVMPLHSAVAGRAYEATRLLLERGAPPNAVQAGGWTPVLSAAQHGDTQLLGLLRSFGADCCAAPPGGQTPRQVAIDAGHPDVAEWLAQICSDAAPEG